MRVARMYVCMHVFMLTCTYVCMSVCLNVRICIVRMYVCMHMYAYTRVRMYACTHVCISLISFISMHQFHQLLAVGRWFPPGTPVSSTKKRISSSSFHRLDMTLAVAEALTPDNKPIILIILLLIIIIIIIIIICMHACTICKYVSVYVCI